MYSCAVIDKVAITALAACLPLLCGGCLSLHPLYGAGDLVADPSLVGVWVERESKETNTLIATGDKTYQLTVTDDGKSLEFSVHLLEVGGTKFLDLEPRRSGDDACGGFCLPLHGFAAIRQTRPTLVVSWLDHDWVEQFLKKNPAAIRREDVAGWGIVFTAPAKDLQKFLLAHLATPGAFISREYERKATD